MDVHIGIHLLFIKIKFLHDIIVLWSSFILNQVILNAHFVFFLSEFHKVATLKLNLFFLNCVLQFCMKILEALYLVLL